MITKLNLSYSRVRCTTFKNNLTNILISVCCISCEALVRYRGIIIHQSMAWSSWHWTVDAVLSISTSSCIKWCRSRRQTGIRHVIHDVYHSTGIIQCRYNWLNYYWKSSQSACLNGTRKTWYRANSSCAIYSLWSCRSWKCNVLENTIKGISATILVKILRRKYDCSLAWCIGSYSNSTLFIYKTSFKGNITRNSGGSILRKKHTSNSLWIYSIISICHISWLNPAILVRLDRKYRLL